MTLLSAASSVISVALDGRPSRCESFTYEDFLAQEAKKPKPKLRAVSAEEVRRAATGAGGFSAELVNGAGGWGLSGRRP